MCETRPCVICRTNLRPVFPEDTNPWETRQPEGGCEITISGSWGSDYDMDIFQGYICDDCVECLKDSMEHTQTLESYVALFDTPENRAFMDDFLDKMKKSS